jgi:uncharacterized membrane protein YdjX (TVP38/TMEM64 family)
MGLGGTDLAESNLPPEVAKQKSGLRRYIGPKRALVLLASALVVLAAWLLRQYGLLDPDTFEKIMIARPISAPLLFILVYGVAVLTALPTLPLNLAAGIFWGPLVGGVISTLGTTLGATGAFMAARLAFGPLLGRRFDNRLVAEIQRKFEENGWRFIAFARLNPIVPTGPLNYMLGLTSIGTLTYVVVTFVFLLPPAILVAHIGRSVGSFVMTGDVAASVKALLAVSAAVTVLVGCISSAKLILRLRNSPDR